jgi:hypothetical protein
VTPAQGYSFKIIVDTKNWQDGWEMIENCKQKWGWEM